MTVRSGRAAAPAVAGIDTAQRTRRPVTFTEGGDRPDRDRGMTPRGNCEWVLDMARDTRTSALCARSPPPLTIIAPTWLPRATYLNECIRAGQEAWHRLSTGHARKDWLLVGKACQWLRAEAMRTAHVNKPEGRGYNQEFSDLLKANGFDAIDKSTRSRLFCILDNIDDVEKWLATVPANKRLTLNHPHTIWRAYQRAVVKKPDDGKEKNHRTSSSSKPR